MSSKERDSTRRVSLPAHLVMPSHHEPHPVIPPLPDHVFVFCIGILIILVTYHPPLVSVFKPTNVTASTPSLFPFERTRSESNPVVGRLCSVTDCYLRVFVERWMSMYDCCVCFGLGH